MFISQKGCAIHKGFGKGPDTIVVDEYHCQREPQVRSARPDGVQKSAHPHSHPHLMVAVDKLQKSTADQETEIFPD